MPNYKNRSSKNTKISAKSAKSAVRETFSNISNFNFAGYLKRRSERISKEKEISQKYSELSEKSRNKTKLRDKDAQKSLHELGSDALKKISTYVKAHKAPRDQRSIRQIKPKYILGILAALLIALIIASGVSEKVRAPFKKMASVFVVPAQKGVNTIGLWIFDKLEAKKAYDELYAENEELKQQISDISVELTALRQKELELSRIQKLLELSDEYSGYETVAAHVIAKGQSKWFSTFTIDKGRKQGIEKDMNVIAQGGLAGIVIDSGDNFSTVRAIIDDESSVSAQFENNSELCMINGSISLMEENLIAFSNVSADVMITDNSAVVTSRVSSKYLPGILIGYVEDHYLEANDLTQAGHLKPVVDFASIDEVLIITRLKEISD